MMSLTSMKRSYSRASSDASCPSLAFCAKTSSRARAASSSYNSLRACTLSMSRQRAADSSRLSSTPKVVVSSDIAVKIDDRGAEDKDCIARALLRGTYPGTSTGLDSTPDVRVVYRLPKRRKRYGNRYSNRTGSRKCFDFSKRWSASSSLVSRSKTSRVVNDLRRFWYSIAWRLSQLRVLPQFWRWPLAPEHSAGASPYTISSVCRVIFWRDT
jgi:hypothetical protein